LARITPHGTSAAAQPVGRRLELTRPKWLRSKR